MSLTVPGGGEIPMSGVTWISVAATHRRRGVMRGVMDELVVDARRRGEVACGPARVGGLDLRERRLRAGAPMADHRDRHPPHPLDLRSPGRTVPLRRTGRRARRPAGRPRPRSCRAGGGAQPVGGVVARAHRRGDGSADGLRRVRGRVRRGTGVRGLQGDRAVDTGRCRATSSRRATPERRRLPRTWRCGGSSPRSTSPRS